VKNIKDFYQFWEKLLDAYGDYFADKIFSIYVQAYSYPCSYLLPDEYKESDRLKYEITGGGPEVEIDKYDLSLLNLLVENTRISLVDIAKQLHSSTQMANSRLKKLVKNNVIQAFRVGVDISKFGLKPFKVDIHLQEHIQRKPIMEYIKHHPNLVFISTSAGVSDLELEFDLEDSDKVHQILEHIKQRFPNAIRKYDYIGIEQNHKLRCLPEV
jgi:Lrp/AsnC family leucine-responsive transcriptional regulator